MKLGNFVRKSSKAAGVEGVKHLKRYHLSSNKLISKRNPFEKNCNKAIKRHANTQIAYSIPQVQINNYLAASSLGHLLDGWMYLSDAFAALLNGDSGASIHLAYYAELRSTMSILATEGIGVFDKKHLSAFSIASNCEFPKNYFRGIPPNVSYKQPEIGTHEFVWEAVEKWTNSSLKPDTEILKIFKVKGFNFFELIEFFHPGATALRSVEIVKEWLKEWCFDIKAYRNDRDNRNLVSYRPQRIKNFDSNLDFQAIINELSSFWVAISPLESNKFNLLDAYLLRKLFNGLYTRIAPIESFRDLVERAFEENGVHDQTMNNLLCSEIPYHSDHLIFQQASKKETTPLAIIARATLLLRIAVGMVSQLYESGTVTKEELNFVWSNYGINNGFWAQGNQPPDFDELWTNIQSSISDFKNETNLAGADNNLASLIENNSKELSYLSQIGRACLWGMDF